jgi:uncharacterized protein (TIGR03000 family)
MGRQVNGEWGALADGNSAAFLAGLALFPGFARSKGMNRAMLVLVTGGMFLLAAGVLMAQPGSMVVPPDRAIIIVRAPDGASVTIGGQTSQQRGPERLFSTMSLAPGFTYSYEIVATWTEKGEQKSGTRTVTFRPGEAKVVSFLAEGKKEGADTRVAKKGEGDTKVAKKADGEKKADTEKKDEKKSDVTKKAEKKSDTVKKGKEVWTDRNDPTLPADFRFQGEYVSDGKLASFGCQVIALGNGQFQAVVLPGGLPGAGWDGKNKSLMQGHLEGDKVVFTPATGKRRYLAGPPSEFSATSKFPPVGQQDFNGTSDGKTLGLTQGGAPVPPITLKRIERKSPTLGQKAPAGAVTLFDGTKTDEWTGGRIDKEHGILNTDGQDIRSKRNFSNYTVHLEFLLPYRPDARGQGRGNSGFYQVMQYEVQILDSFGLEGKDNECGGIYSRIAPKVNMCLPPLQWQTYDIEFTNAVRDPGDPKNVAKHTRISCKHNCVVIHDNVEIPGPTGGAWNQPEGTPGPFLLQGHGNPLQFRNIWVVEKK